MQSRNNDHTTDRLEPLCYLGSLVQLVHTFHTYFWLAHTYKKTILVYKKSTYKQVKAVIFKIMLYFKTNQSSIVPPCMYRLVHLCAYSTAFWYKAISEKKNCLYCDYYFILKKINTFLSLIFLVLCAFF